MTWLELVVLVLAVARLARLAVADTITEGIREWVHERWPGEHTEFEESHVTDDNQTRFGRPLIFHDGAWYAAEPTFLGKLIECHWCASVWIALPVVAGWWWFPDVTFVVALPFAIAQAAGLVGLLDYGE